MSEFTQLVVFEEPPDDLEGNIMADLNGLSLYHKEHCPFCHKVRAVMTELKLDIPLVDMNANAEEWQRLQTEGGKGMVPCLRIDQGGETQWMYESDDIIEYLRDNFA
ncbi:hypothetical protein BGL48_07695 [Salinivibrio sp. SS3]|nr:hypothetical protein BGL48_07695 [Salinivibrio sp. BNH]